MIVPEQYPNRIIIDAEIKSETSIVHVLGHASHEEALQIAAFLFNQLTAIQRTTNALSSAVNGALGDDDQL